MKIISFINETDVIHKTLEHFGKKLHFEAIKALTP